jgi:hypothetical protein
VRSSAPTSKRAYRIFRFHMKRSELLLIALPSLRRLLLEGAEGSKLTLSGDDVFHGNGTEGTD